MDFHVIITNAGGNVTLHMDYVTESLAFLQKANI